MRYATCLLLIALLGLGFASACGGDTAETPPTAELAASDEGEIATFTLTSAAFSNGNAIPEKYGRKGENVSPPLEWANPPAEAHSFALICDDPDAPSGTWVHWVVYNIPAQTRSLPEAVARDPNLPDGSRNGKNSWGDMGYDGPQPPGGTHHYVFKLYALDTVPDLEPGANKEALLAAITRHVVGQAELMGTFAK